MIEGRTAEQNRLEFDELEDRELLIRIIHNQEKLMSGLSDLQAAVAANTTAVAAAVAALGTIGDSDAAVEAAATQLASDTALLVAATPVATPIVAADATTPTTPTA
jgi:hypothetical protein